ncbi:hypothetical protein QQP08_017147 [Theobroma cacao]|nr:hypothetical protein QQP08_017147 [Theobroma cacao]
MLSGNPVECNLMGLWQFFFMGAVGVIFSGSSLLSGIIIAALLRVTESLAVLFKKLYLLFYLFGDLCLTSMESSEKTRRKIKLRKQKWPIMCFIAFK